MQKRVVLVSAAVAALGLAAVALGFVAEATRSKAFVRYDGRSCVYRRTPALFCGVAAALLGVAALALSTAAGGCCGRYSGTRSRAVVKLYSIGWLLVVGATVMFLYGASRNAGGTTGLSTSRMNRRGYYYYGCAVLRGGVFATASILSAAATACAVAAYVQHQQAEEPGQFPAPAVAMGQPQWSQPYPPAAYPPPAVGYPAPPQYGYGGGYGPK